MSAPPTRAAAIAAKCRECIHDSEVAGTWKQQASACPITACPLWGFRPLAQGVPAFIAARDPSRLPNGWHNLAHDAAVAIIAGKAPDSLRRCAVGANGGLSLMPDGATCQPPCEALELPSTAQREGGAA